MTEAQLAKLQAEGKIRGYKATGPQKRQEPLQDVNGVIVVTKPRTVKSKGKDFIAKNFWYWAREKGYNMREEYYFTLPRLFRFDYSVPELMIAVEFEGAIFKHNDGHRGLDRFQRDIEKYNISSSMGWIVIRLTSVNYTILLTELNKCYEHRQKTAGA